MKCIACTIAVLTICFNSIQAQPGAFSFGAKGGLNVSDYGSEPFSVDHDLVADVNYHFGLFGNYRLSPRWGIQLEMQYSTKGAQQSRDKAPLYDVQYRYYEFPIVISYHFPTLLFLEIGGYLSREENVAFSDNASSNTAFNTAGFNEGRPHTDHGLIGGVGYRMNSRFNVVLRYLHGMQPLGREILQKNSSGYFRSSGAFYRNRVGQLAVSYRIL